MRKLVLNIWNFLGTKIGHCTRCMRQSLIAAVAAWAAFFVGLVTWPNGIGNDFIGVLAVGLTALWALHISVYTIRALTASTD